ncbi:MAG TPA: lysine transporter LysE [Syntrophaceae bacterium]|jgi:threonine/homoserine/homoserine lactone efflux protein|nr:lysine transporter LysE [Syntrophaceae bacterium]
MTESLTIFISSFIIALSGAMMPGPLLTATISESSQRGFLAGPLLIAGHGILELLLLVALVFGIAPFLQRDDVFAVVAIVGGVILFWMAAGMFRSIPSLSLKLNPGKVKRGSLLINGILFSIANPYWIIWWATIGFGYVLYSWRFGLAGIAFFFAGHILADLAWYSLVAAAVGKGRHLFTDRLYRGIIGTCAVVLVLFSFYFFYAGVQKIIS